MMTPSDLLSSLIVAGLFLFLFIIAEIWRRKGSPNPEHTRKFVHVGAGLIALSFPYFFESHWTILIMAVLFTGVFLVTRRFGLLQSVQGVERITVGEILYPVAIYLTFVLNSFHGNIEFYSFCILTLAVSDAVAGVVGRSLGFGEFAFFGERKSLGGSIAFFASTFIITSIIFDGYWRVPVASMEFAWYAAHISLVLTIVEACSPRGSDNVTIPLVAFLILLEIDAINGDWGWWTYYIKEFWTIATPLVVVAWLLSRWSSYGSGRRGKFSRATADLQDRHETESIMEENAPVYEIKERSVSDSDKIYFQEFAQNLYKGDQYWRWAEPQEGNHSSWFTIFLRNKIVAGAYGVANPGISYQGRKTALIGLYECIDDPAAAEVLLDTIVTAYRSRGYSYLLGPLNGSTWHRYRIAMPSDTPPFFLDVHNKPWYAGQFQDYGFETIARYTSTRYDLRGRVYERVARFEETYRSRGITVRRFNVDDFEGDLRKIHKISLESFQKNFLFTPISFQDFLALYVPVKSMVDPDLALIAEDDGGRPLGFIFAIPDITNREQRTLVIKTVAVLPVPAARGLGTFLVEKMHVTAQEKGFDAAIHALMHESNSSANVLPDGSHPHREYQLFGISL